MLSGCSLLLLICFNFVMFSFSRFFSIYAYIFRFYDILVYALICLVAYVFEIHLHLLEYFSIVGAQFN